VRDLVTAALRAAGAELSSAASVAEALHVLATAVPDVVVSDIGMPGASGYDLVTRVRADPRTARVPIIALTAYGRAEDRADAYRAGFDLHVGKPVEPLRLVRIVAMTAHGKTRTADAAHASARGAEQAAPPVSHVAPV
jgi:CheY-like chemotaxis protein